MEITHACGYEHPCQFTMTDVEINSSDHILAQSLEKTFGYEKEKVPFDSVKTLQECPHLGGPRAKGEKAEVKEVETEETSVSDD